MNDERKPSDGVTRPPSNAENAAEGVSEGGPSGAEAVPELSEVRAYLRSMLHKAEEERQAAREHMRAADEYQREADMALDLLCKAEALKPPAPVILPAPTGGAQ